MSSMREFAEGPLPAADATTRFQHCKMQFHGVMRIALKDLKLDRLVVVYPGERRYALADRVEVIPLVELVDAGGDAASIFKKRRR